MMLKRPLLRLLLLMGRPAWLARLPLKLSWLRLQGAGALLLLGSKPTEREPLPARYKKS